MGILFGLLIGLLMGAGTFITFAAEDSPATLALQSSPVPSPSLTHPPIPLPTDTPAPDPTFTPTITPTQTLAATKTPTKPPAKTPAPTPPLTLSPTFIPTPTTKLTTPYPQLTSPYDTLFAEFAGKYGVDANLLKKIADCESHFNPGVVSPNGLYAGMYQFTEGTWRTHRLAMGADPNPDLRFGARESIETAAYVISRWGAGSWPACSN